MPNWSATNYILRGSEKDIRRFCETVNSCYDKPDVEPNGFGKLWLGNIYAGFGNDPKTIESSKYNLRGCIDPDPESIACLFGPVPDETAFVAKRGKGRKCPSLIINDLTL